MTHIDGVRKCVAFLAVKPLSGEPLYLGSAFFLAKINQQLAAEDEDSFHVVTARHVIEKAQKTWAITEVWLRLNGYAEPLWAPIPVSAWHYHPGDPSIDVAVAHVKLPPKLDHMVIGQSALITDDVLTEEEVAPGDEVLVVGLYRHHKGRQKNIPIVRVGSLACMSEEKVSTDSEFGDIDAYLIEARSIGGLSGSPVFLNLNRPRMKGKHLSVTGGGVLLLGLIHGHVDVKGHTVDTAAAEPAQPINVNTGIATVVPTGKITAVVGALEADLPAPVEIPDAEWPEDKLDD